MEDKKIYALLHNGAIYKKVKNESMHFQGLLVQTLEVISDTSRLVTVLNGNVAYLDDNINDLLQLRRRLLIKLYQCPGCVYNFNDCTRFTFASKKGTGISCPYRSLSNSLPALPRGFQIVAPQKSDYNDNFEFFIYDNTTYVNDRSILKIPVWKHLDQHGNTIIRYMLPATNTTGVAVIQGDVRYLLSCVEIHDNDMFMFPVLNPFKNL